MKNNIIYQVVEVNRQELWSLEEVKNYLRVSHDYDDAIISTLISSATEAAEMFTGLSFYPRRISCLVNRATSILTLKFIPLIKITEILHISRSGKNNIENNFGYIDSTNTKLHFDKQFVGKNIEIEYMTGYAQDIPRAIKHGILMHISTMYDYRENSASLSSEIKDLYHPYRTLKI